MEPERSGIMKDLSRRNFVKKSVAGGMIAANLSVFSGIVRASGGGGTTTGEGTGTTGGGTTTGEGTGTTTDWYNTTVPEPFIPSPNVQCSEYSVQEIGGVSDFVDMSIPSRPVCWTLVMCDGELASHMAVECPSYEEDAEKAAACRERIIRAIPGDYVDCDPLA